MTPPVPPCPSCGQPLTHVALGPDSAPWLCTPCARGFWQAELTPAARDAYRPRRHDWGLGDDALSIRQDVVVEARAARARGTSALPEYLVLLPADALAQLAKSARLSADVRAALVAHTPGG